MVPPIVARDIDIISKIAKIDKQVFQRSGGGGVIV